MKKITALLLCMLFVFGTLCGCAKSDDNENTATNDEITQTTAPVTPAVSQLTAEEAVQIYIDNRSVWECKTDAPLWYGYIFLDLDFDGVLELVQSAGVGLNESENKFFKIDTETNTVYELSYSDPVMWDFEGGSYPQLYRNNATNELKYMVYDNTAKDTTSGGMCIGEMVLGSDDEIVSKKLWSFEYKSLDGTVNGDYEFTYLSFDDNGQSQEIDEAAYEDILSKYEENNTNLILRYEMIEDANVEYTYTELSETELFDLLLRAYNSFSHD